LDAGYTPSLVRIARRLTHPLAKLHIRRRIGGHAGACQRECRKQQEPCDLELQSVIVFKPTSLITVSVAKDQKVSAEFSPLYLMV